MTTTHEGSGNSTGILTLTDFLLARIAEDSSAAIDAIGASAREWQAEGQWVVLENEYEVADASVPTAPHIARHDPARVLVECEAKRRLVDWHSGGHICEDGLVGERWNDPLECDFMVEDPCDNLRVLGSIYADHPDYRQEWKP